MIGESKPHDYEAQSVASALSVPGLPRISALALTALLLVSCAQQKPPEATYNLNSKDDLFQANLVLSEGQDEEVLALMREATPTDTRIEIAPARYGVRWRDVNAAVRWGSSIAEMAVYTGTHVPASNASANGSPVAEHWVYELITAADDPVTLTIIREPPPRIYSATVVAGVFGDRRDIEKRLLDEVHLAMIEFGKKRAPVLDDQRGE